MVSNVRHPTVEGIGDNAVRGVVFDDLFEGFLENGGVSERRGRHVCCAEAGIICRV